MQQNKKENIAGTGHTENQTNEISNKTIHNHNILEATEALRVNVCKHKIYEMQLLLPTMFPQ